MTRLPPQSNPWGRVTEEGCKGDLWESQTLVLSSAASDYALTWWELYSEEVPRVWDGGGGLPTAESHLVEQRSKTRVGLPRGQWGPGKPSLIFPERVRASRKSLGIESLGRARVPTNGVEGYTQPVLSTQGRYSQVPGFG